MNYLGLDVHSANFVLAHLNANGRLCRMYDRATSASTLIETVGKIRGPKTLVAEECHLAQWVKHVLEPYVDHLIICDPRRNRWIAGDEFADDRSSARKLAELMRGGYVKGDIAEPRQSKPTGQVSPEEMSGSAITARGRADHESPNTKQLRT